MARLPYKKAVIQSSKELLNVDKADQNRDKACEASDESLSN
jgi:hypothetical protein